MRGGQDGTRALIDVLLLGRRIPHEHLVAGLAATLRVGALTARPPAHLPPGTRPLPSPARYDRLFGAAPAAGSPPAWENGGRERHQPPPDE